MSISKEVIKKVEKKNSGEIITYEEFSYMKNFNAVALTLTRLNRNGIIERLSKGLYFKPKVTKYGVLRPSDEEILKALIEKKKKGYVSGVASFNKLGLTTQVPNTVEIAGNHSPRVVKIGKLRIKYTKSSGDLKSMADAPLFQILDALQNIKKIPDSNLETVFVDLRSKVLELPEEKIKKIVSLSKKRRPFVRALMGAMIEKKYLVMANDLKSSLNSLTSYKLNISEAVFPDKKKWYIK